MLLLKQLNMFHINSFVESLFNLQFFRSVQAQKRYLERPTIDIKQITGHLENIAFSKNCVALQIRFLHNRENASGDRGCCCCSGRGRR
jgi:hypothetical protein